MAARTTAAAGDWNTSGTWTGGVKPGNGDTATINHAVTVSGAEIVGTSPAAGNVVLAVNAALTIQSGGTLRLRGDALVANVVFTVDQGGTFVFDAHLASSPSTTTYTVQVGSANNQSSSYFKTTGISSNPCAVSSDAGGGNGFFSGGALFTRGGKAQCAWTQFTRIGDGTNRPFAPDMSSGGDSYTFDHCLFDTCGGMGTSGVDDNSTIRFFHCSAKNSLNNWQINANAPSTVGERSFKFVYFDVQPQFFPPGDFTLEDCIFNVVPDVTARAWASWKRNFIRIPNGASYVTLAEYHDVFLYFDDPSGSNPHFSGPDASVPGHDNFGTIYYFNGTDSQGDCWLTPNASVPLTYKHFGCLVMPNAAGEQSGTLATIFGDAFTTVHIEHCTHWSSGGTPGVTVEETSTSRVGQLAKYLGNICYGKLAGNGRKIVNQATVQPGTTDIVLAENCDFNGGFQLDQGRKGNGYDTGMTGAPGRHDVVGDPQFVDSSRSLAAFDLLNGGPGTEAHALSEMAKMNEFSGFNPAYSYTTFRAYLLAGFAPQNPDYANAAHDGGDIGAVPCVNVQRNVRRFRRRLSPAARAG